MKSKSNTEKLIANYLLGIITDTEKSQLDEWVKSSAKHEEQFNRLCSDLNFRKRYERYAQIDVEKAKRQFRQRYVQPSFVLSFKKYAAVFLSPLLVAAAGIALYLSHTHRLLSLTSTEEVVCPGVSEATLTLVENYVPSALVSMQEERTQLPKCSTSIAVKDKLVYPQVAMTEENHMVNGSSEVTDSNVLTTQKGNEFKVTFEDGTSVHLNYNTEIRYPVQFSKNKRVVYLKGEAYFKIAKDPRPFYVVTAQGIIKQYGTEFNVNTYDPNRTEVALVKGSVSILSSYGETEQFITPGQLASVTQGQAKAQITEVDLVPYIAWNKGRFIFENSSLADIVTVLSHWYKVDIQFGNPSLKNLRFTGDLDRYSSISSILHAIARTTNLNIKIKGRNISITDN